MIFIDSNIAMYLVGAPHPKADAQRLLGTSISETVRVVTDAEVLQEILHRYTAIGRRDAIQPCFDALMGIVDEIFPVDVSTVEQAKLIVLGHTRLAARDAIHLAVMKRQGVEQIMTFDSAFDDLPGVRRVLP